MQVAICTTIYKRRRNPTPNITSGFGAAVVFAGTVAFPEFVAFDAVVVVGGTFVEVDSLGVALSFSTSTFNLR